ncbi:hypothetical protein QBC40DRAFT_308523 [Triangularia verruculosa]|uniref:Uncharacterized protein n=1 Tax=Triangularia verruculosa TaxID=2587418 RepID=A0AAN7AR69_9PEZI|nr:hypothetical protein QBC40DRAFT_308523 [Triangularia verruculosa]
MLFQSLILGSVGLKHVHGLPTSVSRPVQARQYYPDPDDPSLPPSPEDCLRLSFSEPAWSIYDPALLSVNVSDGGTQGDIRFYTRNVATGQHADCRVTNIELNPKGAQLETWYNCNVTDLQFQFLLDDFQVRLRGGWKCAESELNFHGHGVWEEPVVQGCLEEWNTPRGQETLCIMGGSYVVATLTSPMDLQPQWPLLPYTPFERAWRCVDRSWDPEFTVHGLKYQRHLGSYEFSLDVENHSSGERTICKSQRVSQGSLPTDGSTPWVKCSADNGTLDVLLDTTYDILGIRQEWKCNDNVKDIEPENYRATGFIKARLACGEATDKSQEDYDCTLPVPAAPLTFTGYPAIDKAVLPPFPHTFYNRSCTINSISNTHNLTLNEYKIETTDDGKLEGTFGLYNPGPGETWRLFKIPVLDDANWHDCIRGGEGELPWQLADCKYSLALSPESPGVRFELGWYCDDRDPSNAILFSANAQASFTENRPVCQDGVCQFPSSVTEVTLQVSNLTWETGHGVMQKGPILPWV